MKTKAEFFGGPLDGDRKTVSGDDYIEVVKTAQGINWALSSEINADELVVDRGRYHRTTKNNKVVYVWKKTLFAA